MEATTTAGGPPATTSSSSTQLPPGDSPNVQRTLSKGWESGEEPSQFRSYDKGIYENLQEALGYSPVFWLLPSRADATGDGLSYESSRLTKAAAEIHCDVCECWNRLCSMIVDVG